MTPEDKTPTLTYTSTLHFHKIIYNMYFVNYILYILLILVSYCVKILLIGQGIGLTFVIGNSIRSTKVASAVTPSLEEVLFLAFGLNPRSNKQKILTFGIRISAQFQPKPQSKQANKNTHFCNQKFCTVNESGVTVFGRLAFSSIFWRIAF